MPSIYQPRITRYVTPDGRRCRKGDPGARKVRKKCRKWWGKYTDDAGTQHTAPLSTNRTAALRMLADLVDTGADPYRRWASVLLTGPDGHLAAFADHQRAEGVTEAHVLAVAGQLARVVAGCGWRRLADLDAGQANQCLREWMRDDAPAACPPGDEFDTAAIARILGTAHAGEGVTSRMRRLGHLPARRGRWLSYPRAAVEALLAHQARGLAPATRNRYVASLKAFGAWLAGPGKRLRPGTSPFACLGRLNEEADLRHDRRALTSSEVSRLLDTVRASARVVRGLTGEDRWHLYLLALATGFRVREVGTLRPCQFEGLRDDATTAHPIVWLPVRGDKARRGVEQPIPPALVPVLSAYLDGRPPHRPIWPAKWGQNGWPSAMIQRDYEDAGIPVVAPGRNGPLFADFHSLRHTLASELDRAGVGVKSAMALMRHSRPELTLKRYGKPDADRLAGELSRVVLPGLMVTPMVVPMVASTCEDARERERQGGAKKAGATRRNPMNGKDVGGRERT